MMMFRGALLLTLCTVATAYQECMENGRIGRCVSLNDCTTAREGLKYNISPTTCWYQGLEHIVCCFDHLKNNPTKEVVWREVDGDFDNDSTEPTCPPIAANLTSSKIGRKAWDMCLEYQEILYPCEKSEALGGPAKMTRADYCVRNADQLIVGGTDAERNEFPHMALLGYVNDKSVYWICGGSLISDKFILTAGHCLASSLYGEVAYAYVGALKRSEITDPKKMLKIEYIHRHPDYHSPKKYNDIALLELERRVELSVSVVPACLPVGNQYNDFKVKATGWGLTTYNGVSSNILQKVDLLKFPPYECSEFFTPRRYLERGFDETSQLCYGDRETSKDSCQGDSGGPIQISHPQIHCMYMIVGVTSTGFACGVVGQPGLYTRVAHYVPWIESIVWP